MKNADKSAYPFSPDLEGIPPTSETYKRSAKYKSMGLTKREEFSVRICASIINGIVSRGTARQGVTGEQREQAAIDAVSCAEALLAELENTEEA